MFDGSLDELATKLNARPKKFVDKLYRGGPERQYRIISLHLSTGGYGTLTELKPGTIEIGLQIHRHEFVHEDDYSEVITSLQLDPREIDKLRGNFTWVRNRKAKKVSKPDVDLSEDWWNHVRVVPSSSKRTSRTRGRA
jgi:hypothetical protein